jgi:hypothetical protein
METGHRREICGQCLALARFKLLKQVIHGLLDKLLRGVVALRGALLVRGFAAERRTFTGICRFSALGGLKKDIHFMTGEFGAERRCQLPKPEGARKRARRSLCRAELHKRS